MGQRSRVFIGSVVGAVAVHLAMLACNTESAPTRTGSVDAGRVEARDSSALPGADAPEAPDAGEHRVDAGDMLDAMLAGDVLKALDVAGDVVRDAVREAVDREVPDAHAGPNDCQCIRPRETTFTLSVNRGRGAETPVARFSTANAFLTAVPGPAGVQGEAAYQVQIYGAAYLGDATSVSVNCVLFASRSGQYLPGFGRFVYGQSQCSVALYANGVPTPLNAPTFTPPTFPVFTNDAAEVRVASISGGLSGDAGVVTVNNIVFRLNAPGGRLLDEAAPAFRP